ncbi:MAG TPA: hypothetical protein VFA94_00375 [Acidimicrobiales bacterium]|nr:hypothetical protein [Acidimicrobiales bacterium]
MTTATLVRAAIAVLDESGRVVVIFAGKDAAAAAEEWQAAGYRTQPLELS